MILTVLLQCTTYSLTTVINIIKILPYSIWRQKPCVNYLLKKLSVKIFKKLSKKKKKMFNQSLLISNIIKYISLFQYLTNIINTLRSVYPINLFCQLNWPIFFPIKLVPYLFRFNIPNNITVDN